MAPHPEDMRKLLIQMVRQLVEYPDAVSAEMTESGNSVQLLLRVNPSDVETLVGTSGRRLDSLRKILGGVSVREGQKYSIDIDEGGAGT